MACRMSIPATLLAGSAVLLNLNGALCDGHLIGHHAHHHHHPSTGLLNVPACDMSPTCKSKENCASPIQTESESVFNSVCLNNKAGAERSGTGTYNKNKEGGIYKCSCCGHSLYSSAAKYDSGSGWPSYWKAYNGSESVLQDAGDGELVCKKCGLHLGHIFSDGPSSKGGKRHCINSACLHFLQSDSESAPDETVSGASSGGGGFSFVLIFMLLMVVLGLACFCLNKANAPDGGRQQPSNQKEKAEKKPAAIVELTPAATAENKDA